MATTIKAWFIRILKEFEHDLVATTIKAWFIRILGYRSKISEQDLVAATIKAWFMEACPISVNDPTMEADFDWERSE